MSKVHYLNDAQGSLHEHLYTLAEDAEITSAIIIAKKDGNFHISGGGMTSAELCALAILVDEMAREALLGE